MKLRVMLVDDHAMFRLALRASLEMWPDIEIAAEAGSASEALASLLVSRVDVVCLDVNLPDMNGVLVVGHLLAQQPDVKIIGLSAHTDLSVVAQMLHAGAQAYVDKIQAGRDLYTAIQTVSKGQIFLSPDLDLNDVFALIATSLPKCAPAYRNQQLAQSPVLL
jgi:DNA-binding NarL/FixJ family response regulator